MANPKKKHTRYRTGIRRRSNWYKLESFNVGACPNCSELKLPHRACASCGFYAGRMVLAPKTAKSKKEEGPSQQQ